MDFPETIGRYRIIELLGDGGMATVYRAHDPQLGREVALKLLSGELAGDKEFYFRFEREAKLIARLEHPNIVRVYDVGVLGERPYLVMQLLNGGTLRQRLNDGNLTVAQAWPMLRQVAAALDAAHEAQVVHRDVKPENILFDEEGKAFLSDFGVAQAKDIHTGLTGQATPGTPEYMSPEQFRGERVDGRSDQYSLAVIAFEALTGRLPLGGKTMGQIMTAHLHDTPSKLHVVDAAYSPEMSAVLGRALEKEPLDRYPTVTAFVEALEAEASKAAEERRRHIGQKGSRSQGQSVQNPQVEGFYQAGREAYQRRKWEEAIERFGRVLELEPEYKDAVVLRRRAAQNLQQEQWREKRVPAPETRVKRDTGRDVAVPPPVPAPQPAGPRRRWPLAVALLLIVALALFGYGLWPLLTGQAAVSTPAPQVIVETVIHTATAAPTNTVTAEPPTLPPPTPNGNVMIVSAGEGSTWQTANGEGALTTGGEMPFFPDDGLILRAAGSPAQMVLPNGERLFLEADSVMEVVTAAADGFGGTELRLHEGKVVVVTENITADGLPFVVTNPFGASAILTEGGILGVRYALNPFQFMTACVDGSCQAIGDLDTTAVNLRSGQASIVGGDGQAGSAVPIPYQLFAELAAGLVATPTATSVPTQPPTATPTVPPTRAPITTLAPATPTGTVTSTPSPDSDADGIPDFADACPNVAGPTENNGCPVDDDSDDADPPSPSPEPPTNTPELPTDTPEPPTVTPGPSCVYPYCPP